MKITDIPLSPLYLKIRFSDEYENYLLESFTDFLQVQSLITKSSQNKTLKLWLSSVTYQEFSEQYDSFWKQFLQFPGGKLIEAIGGIGIQLASLLSGTNPPKRSIIRETGKVRIAVKLLDLVR